MSESYTIPIRSSFEAYLFVVTYKKPTVTILEIASKATVTFTEGIDCKSINSTMYTTPTVYKTKLAELQAKVNTYNVKFINSIPQDMRVPSKQLTMTSSTNLNVEPELRAIRSQLDRITKLCGKL